VECYDGQFPSFILVITCCTSLVVVSLDSLVVGRCLLRYLVATLDSLVDVVC
jgi:hypothetical protein